MLCRDILQEGAKLCVKSLLSPANDSPYYFEVRCNEINKEKPKFRSKFRTRINWYFSSYSHLLGPVEIELPTWSAWSFTNKNEGQSKGIEGATERGNGWKTWLSALK